MNYYEELGIKPDADEGEIRKAHRRLVKLMHPDQQLDPSLKLLAETQMRRLNSIVSTLLNPEERQDYDDELRGRSVHRPPLKARWRAVPWWVASTVGAVVLTVGAVGFWADHLGSSFNKHTPLYIPPQETKSVPNTTDTTSKVPDPTNSESAPAYSPTATNPPTIAVVGIPQVEKQSVAKPPGPQVAAQSVSHPQSLSKAKPDLPVSAKAKELAAAKMATAKNAAKIKILEIARALAPPDTPDKKKVFNLPAGTKLAPVAVERSHAALPPAPGLPIAGSGRDDLASVSLPSRLPTPVALRDIGRPAGARSGAAERKDPLEGEWVYSPKEPEKHKPDFYPPEFIRLNLTKQPDGLYGQYNARYDVADNRPISPDVSFQLKSVDKGSRKFVWQSSNGSKGTLTIRSVEGETLRLDWRTTVFAGGSALTSGIATLVRRSQ